MSRVHILLAKINYYPDTQTHGNISLAAPANVRSASRNKTKHQGKTITFIIYYEGDGGWSLRRAATSGGPAMSCEPTDEVQHTDRLGAWKIQYVYNNFVVNIRINYWVRLG